MSEFYDELENRDHEEREREIFTELSSFLEDIKKRIPAWKKRLEKIDCSKINSRETLAEIPVLRKPELMESQKEKPPFGEFVDPNLLSGLRIFMSPGPVWEVQGPGPDAWLSTRAFHAAGFTARDIVHCSIGFSLTPGGAIFEEGIRALGSAFFPAGVGNTELQVEAAATLKATAYAGTPDYLKTLLDKADEMGLDLSSINKALVSGGALFPSMREEYKNRGVNVMQAFATADFGCIAYESMHNGALVEGMICNEKLIVEIVRPGTDDPVSPGEVGEIVVTSFNKAYPLIRFGTGDMSAIIPEPSPCGRTNMRIKGWMGRADQRTKIKGMFVDPKQIAEIVKASSNVSQARLEVMRDGDHDVMLLKVVGDDIDAGEVQQHLQKITKLKGHVEVIQSLPNDGKVIDDQRDYES